MCIPVSSLQQSLRFKSSTSKTDISKPQAFLHKKCLEIPLVPMVPDLEKSPVTELHVRMDCNGCVHRIKKAMHGLDGVYSVSTDIAQQKLTVVGNIDPAMIVKAIKKARKTATVCSHTDPAVIAEPQPAEPAPEAPTETVPPTETQALDANTPPEAHEDGGEAAEIHMVHHYPQSYNHYPQSYSHYPTNKPYEAEPYYVASSHGYNNSYRPSNYTVQYGHNYIRSPPRDSTHYSGVETVNDDIYDQNRGGNRDGEQMGSIFSDENPNACRII